jgi:hypothetical protein
VPDGRTFAAIHTHVHQQDTAQELVHTYSSQQGNRQDIAIFAVDSTLTNVQQLATLTLPQLPSLPQQSSFVIRWLSWSPDGKWLTFGDGNMTATY